MKTERAGAGFAGQGNGCSAAARQPGYRASGFILDGFPRTLPQADFVDEQAAPTCPPGALPVVAVRIQVDYTQLLRRITGRRNCPVCGTNYNIYLQPPKIEGVCDIEGAALEQRSDDTEECFAGPLAYL